VTIHHVRMHVACVFGRVGTGRCQWRSRRLTCRRLPAVCRVRGPTILFYTCYEATGVHEHAPKTHLTSQSKLSSAARPRLHRPMMARRGSPTCRTQPFMSIRSGVEGPREPNLVQRHKNHAKLQMFRLTFVRRVCAPPAVLTPLVGVNLSWMYRKERRAGRHRPRPWKTTNWTDHEQVSK
jgi:hypothetical protein